MGCFCPSLTHRQPMEFYLHVSWFSRLKILAQMLQNFCGRCHSFMSHGLVSAKQGGGFAFCLLPVREEAALGLSLVSPVTLSLLLV